VIRPPDASYFSIIHFRDVEGRPLGEGKHANLVAGAPMILATCRYPGSRFEHPQPMNLSALQQVRRHWRGCRGLLDWARAKHGRPAGAGRATLSDLWRSARVAQTLPGWLLLRHQDPVADGALPASISATFKIVIGITYAVQDLQLRAVLEGRYDEQAPADPAALLDHVERHALLIGPAQVCAGPAAMIREVVALLAEGDRSARLEPAAAALLGDGSGPTGYAACAARFYAAGSVMQLFVHALTTAIARLLGPDYVAAEPARQATAYLRAALPESAPLRAAASLPSARLAETAEAIDRFMTGGAVDAGPMAQAVAKLIASYRAVRRCAEARLAEFIGAVAAPLPPAAPIVPLLATQLALEQAWLRLNRVGEAGLTGALGRAAPARPMTELDRLLGRSVLRGWFEAALGLEIAQREGGAWLRRGDAQLFLPAALL
jgi:hypothetical protein